MNKPDLQIIEEALLLLTSMVVSGAEHGTISIPLTAEALAAIQRIKDGVEPSDPKYVEKALMEAGYDVEFVFVSLRKAGLPFSIFDSFYRKAAANAIARIAEKENDDE